MEIKRVYLSMFLKNQLSFQRSFLLLPFAASQQEAREALLAGIPLGEVWQLSEGALQLFVRGQFQPEGLVITQLLGSQPEAKLGMILQMVEKFAKGRFCPQLQLGFPPSKGTFLKDWGYQERPTGMVKTLIYRTALVLGGGGARGAYQIGVWQALQEEDITFHLVTGTSVGALNGGLILMGDLAAARDLWSRLNTENVLQFPAAAVNSHSLGELLEQIRSLTATALRENGTSTQPLQEMISGIMSPELLAASPYELYVCTTRLPDFKEVDHHFDKANGVAELPWLIASASFYPAMKTTEIAGTLYMDGGYRNNLPEDVAIREGATEVLLVDVKGPGIIKRLKRPTAVCGIEISTPWTLGNFLVFNEARSGDNYQLGYLEAKKTFGKYCGYWYTFPEGSFDASWWRFCRQQQQQQTPLWQAIKKTDFIRKMTPSSRYQVVFETAGRMLLEYLGWALKLPPYEIYQEAAFCDKLQLALHQQQEPLTSNLSVAEWLQLYADRLFVFSDVQQALYLQRVVETQPAKLADYLLINPQMVAAISFLQWLIENKGE